MTPTYEQVAEGSQRPKPHRLDWMTWEQVQHPQYKADDQDSDYALIAKMLGCEPTDILTVDSETDCDGYIAMEKWILLRYMNRGVCAENPCFMSYGLPHPYDMKIVKWDDGGVCAYFIRKRDRHKLPEQHGGSALPAVSS